MRNLLVIVFLVMVKVINAQVAVGIYGGIDQSKVSGDVPRDLNYEFKRGYVFGLCFDKSIAKDVFISIRPNYTVGGANISVRGDSIITPGPLPSDPLDTVFQFPITNKYFAVPALVKVHVTRGFYANSGIDFSYNMSSKADLPGSELDITEKVNKYLVSAVFGFGGSVPIGRTSINLEITYSQGLNTFTRQEDIEEGTSPRLRTKSFRLSAYFIVFTSKRTL